MPDKEGVGQSQMEESSTGHKGAANAEQEASDSKQETHEKSHRPGESDSKRSLGMCKVSNSPFKFPYLSVVMPLFGYYD